MKTISGHQEFW